MLRIRRDMCLPHVLEVMIVRSRAATFDLREDATPWSQAKEEVRSGPGHEAVLRCDHHLLTETNLEPKESRDDVLDGSALCAMNVDGRYSSVLLLDVVPKLGSNLVHTLELMLLHCRHRGSDESRVRLGHGATTFRRAP